MNLVEIIVLLIILLVSGVTLAALLLLCDLLAPWLTARAAGIAARAPLRSFAVGLANLLFFGLVAATLSRPGGLPALLALLVTLVLLAGAATGLSALAGLVGARLLPARPHGARTVLAGAVVLELAALAPLIGWLLVPTLAIPIGLGAVISALLRRRAPAPTPQGEQVAARE